MCFTSFITSYFWVPTYLGIYPFFRQPFIFIEIVFFFLFSLLPLLARSLRIFSHYGFSHFLLLLNHFTPFSHIFSFFHTLCVHHSSSCTGHSLFLFSFILYSGPIQGSFTSHLFSFATFLPSLLPLLFSL